MIDLRIDKGNGGGGGTGGDVDIAQSTGNSTTKVMSQKAVSDRIEYTNTTPVPTALGGVAAGTTFNKESLSSVLTKILYPYQNPSFSMFRINGVDTLTLEVGEEYPAGSKTFTWSIANVGSLKANSIVCNGVAIAGNPGTDTQSIPAIVKNTATSHTFTITAKNTNDVSFSKSITLNWKFRMYFGIHLNDTVTDEDILSMDSQLATSRSKTYDHMCSAGEHFYIAYPSIFGDMNNIKISNQLWNDFVLVKRNVVNQFGVSIPFNIYRSVNKYYGKVTVAWN